MRPQQIVFAIVALMHLQRSAAIACTTDPFAEQWLREPIPVRDQFTLTSSYLGISPRAADVLPSGCSQVEVLLGAANTFAKSQSISHWLRKGSHVDDPPVDRVRLAGTGPVFFSDGELHSLVVSYRRGVGAATDVETKLTLNQLSGGGFGDRIIEGFHHLFGLGNDVRDLFPPNLQLTYIRTGTGEMQYAASSYTYSSLVVSGTRELARTDHQAFAVRGLVKLPLQTSGFASRSADEGIELIWRRRFRNGTLHASVAAIHDGPAAGLGTRGKTNVTWAAEWVESLTKRLAVSAQLIETKSALSTLRMTELRRPSYQFSAGLRRQISARTLLLFNVIEHVEAFENGADVGLQLGLSWRP